MSPPSMGTLTAPASPHTPATFLGTVTSNRKRFNVLLLVVTTLFFIKFVSFALWITPLWEIPDESGHYSYVEDLSLGHYPILGKAKIARDVTDSWIRPGAHQGFNWIAQHPPLFYAIDAPSVVIAKALGMDFEGQVRSARILSSLFGSLTILGLALFVGEATRRPLLGLAAAIFIGATPMFIHLSSGVTHDTLVACTAAWGAYWYARWVRSGLFLHSLACGFIVGLCAITKLTGLALAVPMFAAITLRSFLPDNGVRPDPWRVLHRTAILWLVTFLPICIWMARNILVFGQPLPDAGMLRPSIGSSEIGFFEMMGRYPVWQNVFLNFIALIGWTGTSHGTVSFVQAAGLAARYFTGIILFTSISASLLSIRKLADGRAAFICLGLTFAVSAYLSTRLLKSDLATVACLGLLATTILVTLVNGLGALRGVSEAWLLFTGAIFVLFFAFLYYHRIWESYLVTGAVKALHGRYFYVVMPFLSLIMLWPLRRSWLPVAALFFAAAAMVVSDSFFLHYVFELYREI